MSSLVAGNLSIARELVGAPLAVLAALCEAVPDGDPIWRQVAHEAQRADEPSQIPAQVDDQSRAAREFGERAVELAREPLAIGPRKERDAHIADPGSEGSSRHARGFCHRRRRIGFSVRIRLRQDHANLPNLAAFVSIVSGTSLPRAKVGNVGGRIGRPVDLQQDVARARTGHVCRSAVVHVLKHPPASVRRVDGTERGIDGVSGRRALSASRGRTRRG